MTFELKSKVMMTFMLLMMSVLLVGNLSLNVSASENKNEVRHIYKNIQTRNFPTRELISKHKQYNVLKEDNKFVLNTLYIERIKYVQPQYNRIKYKNDKGYIVHEDIESTPSVHINNSIHTQKEELNNKIIVDDKEYKLIFAYIAKDDKEKTLNLVKIYKNGYDVEIIKENIK